jgi:hypothetical protein
MRRPFLTVLGAEVVTLLLLVVGWNVWDRRREIGQRLRSSARM